MYDEELKDEYLEDLDESDTSVHLLGSVINIIAERGVLDFDDVVKVMDNDDSIFTVEFDRIGARTNVSDEESDLLHLELVRDKGRKDFKMKYDMSKDCMVIRSGNMATEVGNEKVYGFLAILRDIVKRDIDDNGNVIME